MITFHQPLWIAAGFTCCLLIWLLWHHYERIRTEQLLHFAAGALLPALTANVSHTGRRIKKWLVLLAVLLCFIALARPQYGHRWIDVKHRGIDILFALDTSRSMLAEDVRPNRLERSKLAIVDFISKLSGDRVGLIPFAGTSYLMCPLTADYHAFEQSLMAVDYRTIPSQGTNLESAIDGALNLLAGTANHKILIIISDGEQAHGDVIAAAGRAADNDMVIYTVGVGSEDGELIPDPDGGGFIQDEKGSYVKSRLDSTSLQHIAESAGGSYAYLGDRAQGLEEIYRQKLALVPKTELEEKRKQVPIERFGWPLALAIVLLSLELLVPERKPGQNGSLPLLKHLKGVTSRFKRTAAATIFCATAALSPIDLHSAEAENAYANGNFIEAGEHYQKLLTTDPDNPLISYNSGTTAYKNNLFEDAAEAFDRALTSSDLKLQEKAYFNRGNALYRVGEAALQTQPEQSIERWKGAVASYESVLELNPDNEQATENHLFVREKLEELEQQQNQQQNREQTDEQSDADGPENKDQSPGESPGENEQENRSPDSSDSSTSEDAVNNQPEDSEGGHQRRDDTGEPAQAESSPRTEGTDRSGSESPGQEEKGKMGAARMNSEEALQLLQAMKAEEGRLDFYAPLTEEPAPTHQQW